MHGMTVGTNALLEGRVARTALLATEGFTDLEELGRQARPELYRLCAGHPPPLVPAELRVAVPERTGPDGVLRALDEDALRERWPDCDVEAVAVCLLWGFRHPEHERRAAELVAEELDEVHVSTSHETAGVFREYERCATTVVDAALSPLLRGYLERLAERTRERGPARARGDALQRRRGGAATAARHGSWTVLSGPAGGAVGAARAAEAAGVGRRGGLDMGGTSCDVSVALGGPAAVGGGREVGGPRAGAADGRRAHGGRRRRLDRLARRGRRAARGPALGGRRPRPRLLRARRRTPTVTDADLLLGYLDAGSPLAGGVQLDATPPSGRWARWPASWTCGEEAAAGIARVAARRWRRRCGW